MLSIFMHPTIDIAKSVETSGIPSSTCPMPNGSLAVGDDNGYVSIFNSEGELIESHKIEGKVIGLIYLENTLVVGSSISGVSIISDSPKNLHLSSGCEILIASGSDFLVSDGSGILYRFNHIGELLWQKEIGQVTHISSNSEGTFLAVALESGGVMILNNNGDILHDSPASLDDIETISCMVFRKDVLVVARNSLGLIIDDRPENRVECWSVGRGIIHTSEMESLVNSICSTSEGVILGCVLFKQEAKDISSFSMPIPGARCTISKTSS